MIQLTPEYPLRRSFRSTRYVFGVPLRYHKVFGSLGIDNSNSKAENGGRSKPVKQDACARQNRFHLPRTR